MADPPPRLQRRADRRRRSVQPTPAGAVVESRPTPRATPAAAPHGTRIAVILFFGLLTVYLSNLRALTSGDNVPTRLLPFSILREGNLDLDEFPRLLKDGQPQYFVRENSGHFYSGNSIALPLLVTPLYIVPAWLLSTYGIAYDDVRAQLIIDGMERLTAASLTALSASLLFLVLTRLVSRRGALALTLLYALGTNTWAISSQALWLHGLSELGLVILSLIFLNPAPARRAVMLAGLTTAVMVANRSQTMVFALPTLAFVWTHHRRHLLAFIAAPLVGAGLLMTYNLQYLRSAAGVYGSFNLFAAPLLTGVSGLLISPNRGLFIFTPIMLFSTWGAVQVWRTAAPDWIRTLTIGLALHLLLYGKFTEWWAGYTFGPRYMTDVLPVLCLLLVYGLVPLCRTRPIQILAVALASWGVAMQVIGVYCDNDEWNRLPVPLEIRPERVWDWSDWQVLRAVRSGWHGGELAGLLVSAFTDPQPAFLRSLQPDDLECDIRLEQPLQTVLRAARAPSTVLITNRSAHAWPVFSGDFSMRDTVRLMLRWWHDGMLVPGVGDVVAFPKNICPGETIRIILPINTPPDPGQYTIQLEVIQIVDRNHGVLSLTPYRAPVTVE